MNKVSVYYYSNNHPVDIACLSKDDHLNVKISSEYGVLKTTISEPAEFIMCNIKGQIMWEGNNVSEVTIRDVKPGIYLVLINRQSYKILIE